jgi:phosphoribosylamine--glycine ligase
LLTGPEVSFFVVANGDDYVPLLSAQDHKRIFDGDQGPNTGGMGAFSPSPLMSEALQSEIEQAIVKPVLTGMTAEGNPFRGFLYCGLMLTPAGPKVIEFNVRFGDPEAQVVLPLLGPLAPILSGSLFPVAGSRQVSVGVVLAASGYPGEVRTGDVIHGLDDVARDCPGVQLFFAGVKQKGTELVTSGGRVLTVMATALTYEIAIARAYEAASKIRFEGMQYRRDIGRKALVVGS